MSLPTAFTAARRVLSLIGVVALVAASLTVAASAPAAAASTTFTVQTAGNGLSSGAANGVCDASAAAGTQCTLKEAVKESNANPGMDTIAFDAAAWATPYRITISSAGMLPITDPVLIDGTTQPGYNPSTGAIVRYNGNNQGVDGFTVQPGGSGTVIKGLVMTGWNINAIRILGNNTTVAGNWLGVPSTGSASGLGNGTSVRIEGGNDNLVGGATAAARNVIGQSSYGVQIAGTDPSGRPTTGHADGNQVLGNYLGLRGDGTTAAGNNYGVDVNAAVDTTIGSPTGRNVVGGPAICCPSYGIQHADSKGTVISSNYIGTNAAGTAALRNDRGVNLATGSTATVSNNLISGNSNGIYSSSSLDVTVSNNLVGTDSTGSYPVRNIDFGIYGSGSGVSDKVAVTGNTVSGNAYIGVYVADATVTVADNMLGAASAAQALAGLGNGFPRARRQRCASGHGDRQHHLRQRDAGRDGVSHDQPCADRQQDRDQHRRQRRGSQ